MKLDALVLISMFLVAVKILLIYYSYLSEILWVLESYQDSSLARNISSSMYFAFWIDALPLVLALGLLVVYFIARVRSVGLR